MAKQYEYRVQVQSRGGHGFRFPLDMLRYDRLTPETETDTRRIEKSIQSSGQESEPITLYRWAGKDWKPTKARWESFCWEIVSVQRGRSQ